MWNFAVWAPQARSVAVQIQNQNHSLLKTEGDWWRVEVAEATAGTDYFFVVDGGKPVPDPRSAWQPHGVHGPSRAFNQNSFAWTDANWRAEPLESAIIYELHIGTFTKAGTFESAIERLPYLKELGVTHVELMPVNEFSGDWGWGYDGVDLYAPHHVYCGPSGPDALKRLVAACHERGLAVILDVVYNHLGPAGNYLSLFGPYFTDRQTTPWGNAVNLDGPGSAEVRRFFCENALLWLRDYHMDGLRLDAIHALIDNSEVHFLAQLAGEVKAFGREKFLIAESDLNDPIVVRERNAGGYGMDAQWSDDFHHALHALLTGETSGYYSDFGGMEPVAKALRDSFVYDGAFSKGRKRPHGAPAKDVPQHRFLGYAQTHDQVGNRAQGERLSHLVSEGRVKIAAALVLLSPFTPMLFQGEEFAASTPFQYFTHHEDEELARAVSEGRKRDYGGDDWRVEDVPDPQDPATFERSKLDWSELNGESHRAMLGWYRALIALRKSRAELSGREAAGVEVKYGDGWLELVRGTIHVLCNFASEPRALKIAPGADILLASYEDARLDGGIGVLPGENVLVFHRGS
jgi:maltooligosyltrehalose trehalohydrolase